MIEKAPPNGLSSEGVESREGGSLPVRQPPAAEVRNELERILASDGFSRSDRLARFLQFTVGHLLEGNAGPLKEYVLGVQVFDKGEAFDPRLDPIVRVEAGRLRSKLREYYDGPGKGDRVRIGLPKRGYAPSFRYADQPPVEIPRTDDSGPGLADPAATGRAVGRKKPWHWYAATAGLAVLGLACALYLWESTAPRETTPSARGALAGISVAVLPLKNMSGESGDEYFSDAITDAVITELAQVRQLQVISMTSVLRYKESKGPISEIARELDVTHVLDGSVLRAAGRVRIAVQLVEGRTNRSVWADSFDRDATDVLALQRDVSVRIARALTGEILPAQQAARAPPRIDPAVFETYAIGRYFRNQLTEQGFRKGIEYFRKAINQRPSYAPAYAGMASCYCLLGGHGLELVPPHETISAAKEAALRALQLDDTLAEPHAVLGIIRAKYDWDWEGAERSFKRALDLEPSNAQARAWYSLYLEAMGRHDEAVAQAERARELNPLSLENNVNLAWQLHQANRHDQAFAQLQKTLELNPAFWGAHWALGQHYRLKHRYTDAIAALEKAVTLGGGHTLPKSTLGYTYAISGGRAQASTIARELEAMAQETYVSPAHIAAIYAGLGDKDTAFAWLEKAYLARARAMAWLNVAREWDGLRADPRFAALRRKVGLKH